MVSVRINAKFKDTLFRMIFGGKKELLDLGKFRYSRVYLR